jgi:hypothetical protein
LSSSPLACLSLPLLTLPLSQTVGDMGDHTRLKSGGLCLSPEGMGPCGEVRILQPDPKTPTSLCSCFYIIPRILPPLTSGREHCSGLARRAVALRIISRSAGLTIRIRC